MKYIESGTNSVIFTLYEKSDNVVDPYFVFKITSPDKKFGATQTQHYIFTADDNSPAPYNYNSYTFSYVLGATYGATAGVINVYPGEYKYEVWQTNQYDLDLNNAIKIVEKGIMIING
jgi:hypothetical protein